MGQERVFVYVDGFNLYYGAERAAAKWLNLGALSERLIRPSDELLAIKYYTALISARPRDPEAPIRQQMYLRALKTIPNLSIHYGHFLSHTVRMPLAASVASGNVEYVEVLKTEEKGSDVNLASHLLRDAFTKKFSLAVVVSNDSDLAEPIRIARQELGMRVGVWNPQKNPSRVLQRHSDFFKTIRGQILRECQFPPLLRDAHGWFRKPRAW
jgi:uncharacterized LabA/DUF88 family protein